MMLMGRLGLRRMTAGAMPLAVGADGRWDGATGGVLVVMVAGGCCADRVAVLADDPPDHLVQRIGAAPDTPAGKAVWCHHALDIEATIDRSGGRIPAWIGWSPQNDWVRRQIAVADRLLESSNDLAGPAQWAELALQAGAVLDEVRRVERNRAARQKTTGRQGPQRTPGNGPAAEGPRRGISL